MAIQVRTCMMIAVWTLPVSGLAHVLNAVDDFVPGAHRAGELPRFELPVLKIPCSRGAVTCENHCDADPNRIFADAVNSVVVNSVVKK